MELAFFFYLAGIVDNLANGAAAFTVGGAFLLIFAIGITCSEGAWYKWPKKLLSKLVFIWVFVALLSVFTPNKETMYTMAAAYGVQTAAENPNVQRVAGKSLQLLEGKLDEFLKEEKKE